MKNISSLSDDDLLKEIEECLTSGSWEDIKLTIDGKLPFSMGLSTAQWFADYLIIEVPEVKDQEAQISELISCRTVKDLIAFVRKYPCLNRDDLKMKKYPSRKR